MEKEKVISANKYYLYMGIICSIIFVAMVIATITTENDLKDIIPIFIVFSIIIGGMAFVWFISYIKRAEFYIYSLKKEGIVNFDEINKDYMQVKDTSDKLYFVKKDDSFLYSQYELMNH